MFHLMQGMHSQSRHHSYMRDGATYGLWREQLTPTLENGK